jgi:hypothetical protein
MSDLPPKAGVQPEPSAETEQRGTSAARVRRLRARRKAGVVMATVELDQAVLEMLAQGRNATVDALRADRAARDHAARSALAYLSRLFEAYGGFIEA